MKPLIVGCEGCGCTFQINRRDEDIVTCPECGSACDAQEQSRSRGN